MGSGVSPYGGRSLGWKPPQGNIAVGKDLLGPAGAGNRKLHPINDDQRLF